MTGTNYVYIDGHRHEIVDLATLDRLVWPDCLVELPPNGAGWATTRVGSVRFAAWLDWAEVTA